VKIDSSCNIVIPVGDVQVFSSPLPEAVFESSYRIIAAAQDIVFSHGLRSAIISGPRIAAIAIRDAGKAIEEDGGVDSSSALLAEIKRISTALVPTDSGFDMVPIDAAIKSGAISQEDWKEAEGTLAFFTCVWYAESRKNRKEFLEGLVNMMNFSCTSQNCADFVASLTTSNAEETASKPEESSVPT